MMLDGRGGDSCPTSSIDVGGDAGGDAGGGSITSVVAASSVCTGLNMFDGGGDIGGGGSVGDISPLPLLLLFCSMLGGLPGARTSHAADPISSPAGEMLSACSLGPAGSGGEGGWALPSSADRAGGSYLSSGYGSVGSGGSVGGDPREGSVGSGGSQGYSPGQVSIGSGGPAGGRAKPSPVPASACQGYMSYGGAPGGGHAEGRQCGQ